MKEVCGMKKKKKRVNWQASALICGRGGIVDVWMKGRAVKKKKKLENEHRKERKRGRDKNTHTHTDTARRGMSRKTREIQGEGERKINATTEIEEKNHPPIFLCFLTRWYEITK